MWHNGPKCICEQVTWFTMIEVYITRITRNRDTTDEAYETLIIAIIILARSKQTCSNIKSCSMHVVHSWIKKTHTFRIEISVNIWTYIYIYIYIYVFGSLSHIVVLWFVQNCNCNLSPNRQTDKCTNTLHCSEYLRNVSKPQHEITCLSLGLLESLIQYLGRMDIAIANTKDIANEPAPTIRNNSSSALREIPWLREIPTTHPPTLLVAMVYDVDRTFLRFTYLYPAEGSDWSWGICPHWWAALFLVSPM